AVRGGEELVLVEVLAAQDAVDVGDGDLDLLDGGAAHLLQDIRGRPRRAGHDPAPGEVGTMRSGYGTRSPSGRPRPRVRLADLLDFQRPVLAVPAGIEVVDGIAGTRPDVDLDRVSTDAEAEAGA